MNSIIQLHQLNKSFQEGQNNRTVLRDVSGSFNEGEFAVLLGRSGSGKSTLLNLISGIEEPDSGSVSIEGVNITQLSERQRTLFRRDTVGFVFQFFNLIPTLTVLENITLPQELAGLNGRSVKESAITLLEQIGLGDRQNTFPDKLSGGEQQRVAIARALAHNPKVVLADEPTGNLDEETGEKILNMLLRLTREAGKTLIMATHSPEVVPYADRVFYVQDGQLLEKNIEQSAANSHQPQSDIQASISNQPITDYQL
ncbi:MAG: ABC transporter ATP-binding protein [Chloroflexota bacterium]